MEDGTSKAKKKNGLAETSSSEYADQGTDSGFSNR